MAKQALLYVDGVELPNPTQYDVTVLDIDSSETARNERGVMTRNRVRQGAVKISLSWTLRSPEIASLLSVVTPAAFSVRFFDPKTYNYGTATMYVGDRTCTMKLYTPDMDFDEILWEYKMSFIEY